MIMFFSNGFVYGGMPKDTLTVKEVKPLSDMILLLRFSNGEMRLFDATCLNGEVFEPLKKESVFKDCKLEYGVPTWCGGSIDCAPEYIYEHSYEYISPEEEIAL